MLARSTHALALLPLLAFAPAAQAIDIPCTASNQIAFYASFGDNTQVDDGNNTVDDPYDALYNMPAGFLAAYYGSWGNHIARTDQLVVDAAHPAVLQGYSPFDYEDTLSAFLRFDLYFIHYSDTEGFSAIDESDWSPLWNFAYYTRLHRALVAHENDVDQWVSVRVDLLTGNAYAWQIDAYGNPVYDYGQFAVWGEDSGDSGDLYRVLKSAMDGDLYTLLYDDVPLSYEAFYGVTRGKNDCL